MHSIFFQKHHITTPQQSILNFHFESEFTIEQQSSNHHKNIINESNNSLNYQHAFLKIIEGTLLKKTNNKTYSEKYFVLTATRLLYYTNMSCKQLQGCFNLISLEQIKLTRTKIKINLEFMKGKLEIKANNLQIADRWYHQLHTLIHNKPKSDFNQYKIFINYEVKYWNSIIISMKQFSLYADSFDLILFKTKLFGCSVQRLITGSQYDHIALVLRTQQDELLLLQATSSQGVSLIRWEQLKEAHLISMYQKIAYRKLLYTKRAGMMEELQQYLEEIVGKKYELNLKKLLRKNSTYLDSLKQKQTFFCSQLIAAVYKKFGFLQKKRSSSNYWPKDFSIPLRLQDGRLSDIMQIQLDKLN